MVPDTLGNDARTKLTIFICLLNKIIDSIFHTVLSAGNTNTFFDMEFTI